MLLNAGCLCCTVRGDLVRALRELLPRVGRGRGAAGGDRDHRAGRSGADPAHADERRRRSAVRYRLDGIVTVVDAVNGTAQLDAQAEAVRQVAVADRLVLTKTDLADPAAVAALTARLRRLNPGAPLLAAVHGAVEPAALLDAGLFDAAGKIADVRGWLDAEAFARPATTHHHHHHDVNRHDARIARLLPDLRQAAALAGRRHLPGDAGRHPRREPAAGQGHPQLAGQDRPVAIHGVQHVFHPPALLPAWPPATTGASRLVFITRDLDRATVAEGFRGFRGRSGRSKRTCQIEPGSRKLVP